MGIRVGTEQVCRYGMLKEGVAKHLQPLQIEAIACIRKSQGLQNEAGVGSQTFGGVFCQDSALVARG